MRAQFFYHDFNAEAKVKFFSTDFYYNAHFLFIFKFFDEDEEKKADEYVKQMQEVRELACFYF